MKVLFVFNHPAPYKVRLFNEICKEIELDVIFERKSASDRPADFYNCNRYDFNVMFLKKGAFSKENSNTGELKQYIKENFKKYDLIVMNGYSTLTEMRAIHYLKKHHSPYVLYVNGGVIRKDSFFKKKLKMSLISGAFHYFSPCEESNEYLIHYGARKKDISTYIYSTLYDNDVLEAPLSDTDKRLLRTKYDLPNGKIFVSAAQFISRKNNIQLITEFIGRKETLLLIGEGPEKEEYKRIVADNKLTNVIIKDFLPKDELFKVMRCCDCFVTLSKEDIFGHTCNEAMACGLPVISSKNVVASLHLIKDDYNGYLVDIDDHKAIQKALNSVKESMNQNAINTAKENTIEASAKMHIELFKEVAKCE